MSTKNSIKNFFYVSPFYTFLLTTLFLLGSGGSVFGQVTIHTNNCSSATAGWVFTNGTTTNAIQQSTTYWLLEDNDVIISQAFDVSTYTGGLILSFDLATYGSGSPDKPILVEYSTDNGTTWSATTFTSATPSSSSPYISSGNFNISSSLSTQFKFRFKKASIGGRAGVRLDNILFRGIISNFSLTYNGNGNTSGTAPIDASSPYTSGSMVTVLGNTGSLGKTGYAFAGWNTLANGTGTAYTSVSTFTISANTELFAQWTPNNNTITFDGNGATSGATASQVIPTAGSATLNNNGFSRTGYSFAGWSTTAGGAVAFTNGANYTMGTTDVTLYAVWLAAGTHTVTFDANGGTGSMANQVSNSSTNLTSNAFTRTGYTFTGWNTASNGSGTSYTDGQLYNFSADLTLFAQWQINAPILSNQSFSGTIGNLFTENPTNTGGTASSWTLSSGSLPAGISLNSSTGQLSGTPSVSGTFTFSLNASNSTSNSTASYTISISAVPSSLANYLFTGTSCTAAAFSPSSVVANTSFSNISTNTITCNTNAANSFSGTTSTSWGTAFSSTRYIEFTITPSSGYLVTLTSLNFDVWRSGAGATNVVVRSSLDGYVADLATESVTTTSANKTVTLSSSFVGLYSAITFRIYGFGGNSTGDLRLDNINLLGYVYPACTPPADPAGTFNLTSNCGNTDVQFLPTLPIPSGVDYFWQSTASGVSTAGTDAISVVKNTTSNSTFFVRAYHAGDNCWSTNSVSQLVTIVNAPYISTEPVNASVVSGNTATFSVVASNASSYQWQVNTGSGWNNVSTGSGATTATYQTENTTSGMNGYFYRVVVGGTSPCTPINSNGLALTVSNATVNSISNQSSVYGSTVSVTATATGAVSSWSATLPAGLSINSSGVISGTLTEQVAGSAFASSVTANFTAGGSDTKIFTWTITPKALTVSGLTGSNKEYDGNTTATLTGTGTLNGVVGTDVVSIAGTPSATFSTATVGNNKPITVTGYTLSGAQAGNYTLTQPTGITANITPKALTVTGATAQDKVYDGNTTASITGGTLVGVVGLDAVTLSGGGTFASENAGTGITVTASLTLAGAQAGNYNLTQPTGLSANITKANPVFTTSTISITLGGTYSLPGANISSTSDGAFSYTITSGGNATLGGTTITGAVVGSETLTVNQAASANFNAGITTVAVNVTTFNTGDYRTVGGGNWHSTAGSNDATWEQFNGTSWVSSSAPATNAASLGSRTVYIRDSIYLVGTNTAPNVVVENGGILHTSTVTATFGNLLVRTGGKFYRQANGSGVSGTFEVEDNATVYFFHTNTTSRTTSIWAGTEKFHSNSNFIIRSSQNTGGFLIIEANTDISEYNGACFGNLYIDLGAGKMNLIPAGFTKTLANNLYFVKGTENFTITSGTSNLNILNDFVVESTFIYNLAFMNAAATINSSIGGDFIMNASTNVRTLNNSAGTAVVVVSGDVLINSGTVDINFTSGGQSTFNMKGHFTVATGATFTANTSTTAKTIFSGGNVQNVSGGGTINVYYMEVNKSGGYVNLLRDLQAKIQLTMTQGHVYTNANLLELGESTTQKGTLTYTSGYVVGRMKRWFNGTNAGNATGLFPMGVNESGLKNRFSLIEYTSAPSTGGHLTVEFMQTAMGLAGLTIPAANTGGFGYDVSSTEDQGYWKIDNQAGTLTDGAYTISCTGQGFATITDLNQITLLKRVGGGNWFCPGTHQTPTGSIAVPTAIRSGVSGWSNFGFGAPIDVNPLPVELVQFVATCDDDKTHVTWSTASEQNAAYFDVEESVDGINWRVVSKVNAIGNSVQLNGYETELAYQSGTTYYRLNQVDLDGKSTLSGVIVVACGDAAIQVYPNPTNEWIFIQHAPENVEISLFAMDGRKVKQEIVQQAQSVISLQGIEQGTYHLQVRSNGQLLYQTKVVKIDK